METITNVYVNREFNCSAAKLYKWLTLPTLIAQWFGPKKIIAINVEVDLVIGGKFSVQLMKPNNELFFIEGNYLEIQQPEKLSFSFKYRGLENPSPDSIVSISLKETSEGVTKLNLIQEFKTIPNDMEGRTNAWNYMLEKIGKEVDQN